VAVPLVFGLLFGPAGAWGSGLGNVIGDFFGGTLGIGTLFGFVGNFLFALTPYKLLGPAAGAASGTTPAATWRETALFAAAAVPASAVCAATIGWGVDCSASSFAALARYSRATCSSAAPGPSC
jgi:energy-coupling factor transport system substrate-specific component